MKIFSVKQTDTKIKIIILGIKFSIKYIPHYEQKIATNYAKQIKRLQKKYGKEKIKVGFLVSEPAKWQYQSVYEELDKSEYFEPVILVTEMMLVHDGEKSYYKTIEECYDFFKSKNLKTQYAYDKKAKQYISIKDLNIDILFYQQPWQLSRKQQPLEVSKSALTCYVPYGLHLIEFFGSYMDYFHKNLWKMFVEKEQIIEMFNEKRKEPVANCEIVGYPKLDIYFSKNEEKYDNQKPIIIYAPHHSLEKDSIACATFQTNGLDILKMAEEYQNQITWVFKPHPRFKQAVIKNKVMTENEIDQYYKRWQNIGIIYEGGDYFELFKKSSGMITDCCSFLGEYMPTKNPVFHLTERPVKFNQWAKNIISGYYSIGDILKYGTILNV